MTMHSEYKSKFEILGNADVFIWVNNSRGDVKPQTNKQTNKQINKQTNKLGFLSWKKF